MIVINGETWRVRLVPSFHPSLVTDRGNLALGVCDDITRTICISNALSLYELKKVLLHEIVHAVMYSYDIPISDNIEEILAQIITNYGDEIIYLSDITYDKMKFM